MDTFFKLLLLIGIILGFVCIIGGLYLLFKRGWQSKTEVKIKFFGTLKTTETGLALIFFGLVLFTFSSSGFMQLRDKQRIVSQSNISDSVLSLLLTPSLMKEKDFQNSVKALPKNEKDAIITKAARATWNEFHKVTDVKNKDFVPRDFDNVDAITTFLTELDQKNGHALYYKGEVMRLLKDRGRFRENFLRYLDIEASIGTSLPVGIEAEVCYRSAEGYCRQRTGWILHLLANDFYQEGIQENDRNKKRELFERALKKAKKVWKHFPPGFLSGKTTKSTQDLQATLQNELAALGYQSKKQ